MFRSLICLFLAGSAFAMPRYFKIQVVDQETGRGVPLVELCTVHDTRYFTDSNGFIAFHEPGLMGKRVFFFVSSHGYEFPKDGFGYRGIRLHVKQGKSTLIKLKRINIAERLYRITGGGIYRDTVLLGEKPPINNPVLNANVLGSDSVVNTVFQNQLYWFWGDTNFPRYPLGNFHVPGATSPLVSQGLDPDQGIPLSYFTDRNGVAKATAKMPGKGPTWINGLTVIRDQKNQERMFAQYVKIAKPMRVYERGIVEFDPKKNEFFQRQKIKLSEPLYPHGHPFQHREGGVDYIYFANPYPHVRARATVKCFLDPSQYESYTCFRKGSTAQRWTLDRGEDGKLIYGWKKHTLPLTEKLQNRLIKEGKLKPGEALFRLRDVESGKRIHAQSGSVYWNPFRKRWSMITVQLFGSSLLGEVWYAEADRPEGPYEYACRIVTHNRYDFYNPKQHPMLSQKRGQILYFEGTYTNTFSGNPDRMPRYNYNQIMYKLDLKHPRLRQTIPVYRYLDGKKWRYCAQRLSEKSRSLEIAFYALDRPHEGAQGFRIRSTNQGDRIEKTTERDSEIYLFGPKSKPRPVAVKSLMPIVDAFGWRARTESK